MRDFQDEKEQRQEAKNEKSVKLRKAVDNAGKPRVMIRPMFVKITEKETAQYGKDAGKLQQELDELKEAEAARRKTEGGKIKEVQEVLHAKLEAINKGGENRDVKCVMKKDFEGNRVSYHDPKTDAKLDERPMSGEERQMEIEAAEAASEAS